jgi:hypothetical protein
MIARDREAVRGLTGMRSKHWDVLFESQWHFRSQPCGDRGKPAERGCALTWASRNH